MNGMLKMPYFKDDVVTTQLYYRQACSLGYLIKLDRMYNQRAFVKNDFDRISELHNANF